jgi:formate dehydrogenase gamma subunit
VSFKLRSAVLVIIVLLAAFTASGQMSSEECLACHTDAEGKYKIDGQRFASSIHGSMSCADCHADIKEYPHPQPGAAKVDCASCHPDAVATYESSVHANSLKAGNKNAPSCLSCHGGNAHAIVPSAEKTSPTNHLNVPKTCGACHGQKFVMESSGVSTQPAFSYQQSVHGRAVAAGNEKAADCVDCHKAHDVLRANDARSPIFKFNIPQTCGTCHGEVSEVYLTSVHGKAMARGNDKSPVCTDCHGIHLIKPHIDPTSSVAAQNIARTTCGQCHGNVQLTSEFGIRGGRVKSYEESYHGLAKRLGSAEAANCASCHGVHNILPESDPESTIHASNLAATCGTCHPGATQKFAQGKIHLGEEATPPGSPAEQSFGEKVLSWVSLIYIPLIVLTLGGMALHNLIIWIRKARKARKDPTRTIVRMNRNQRTQHFLLVVSFITLVVTGFALAWPESWLGYVTGGETVRRIIHRIAAVVMLLVGLYHVLYMVGTKEGRQGLKDFWFGFKDVRDVIGVIKYNLGLSKVHPKMGRFTYAEKAEYWALIWGTIVMGLTGLMLWFEVQVSSWLQLPRWWVDVALLIHYYEAILATLAIVIWHLYAVIFDPDAYPINWAWYDGKMSESQYKHEHELHYEELMKENVTTEGSKTA